MTLHIAVNNQDILSNKLMCAIRAEIMKPEYDRMYISTLIGVLEMLKLEMYERNEK